MRFLEKHPKRNELIAQYALREIGKGHSLVIPVTFTRHADTLVNLINRKAKEKIATKFTGQVPPDLRRKIILDARSGKIKCVVAMRPMLVGINVPRWSQIFEIMPMNNDPNFEQEILRICTPMPNKAQPIVRFFIDDFQISRACFRSCITTLKRLHSEYGGFEFTPESFTKVQRHMAAYFAGKQKWGASNEFKKYRSPDKQIIRRL